MKQGKTGTPMGGRTSTRRRRRSSKLQAAARHRRVREEIGAKALAKAETVGTVERDGKPFTVVRLPDAKPSVRRKA